MINDSETDANVAKAPEIPVILFENRYTEKNTSEIYHNQLIKDFTCIKNIIKKYI
jgi:phosphoglycolate phosphatase